MTEDLTEQKQIYLRENILDKGLNGQEFMDFMVKHKGENGTDISQWSLEEIKMVINIIY
jgi:hypothetical protein